MNKKCTSLYVSAVEELACRNLLRNIRGKGQTTLRLPLKEYEKGKQVMSIRGTKEEIMACRNLIKNMRELDLW